MPPLKPSLLIRHRWWGDPCAQVYTCRPIVPSLYESPDPLCGGCGFELPWVDIPGLAAYRNCSLSAVFAETLGVRLDLRAQEIQLQAKPRRLGTAETVRAP